MRSAGPAGPSPVRKLPVASAAYPALLLLHGLTFAIALLHFLSIPWPNELAAYFYGVLTLWVLVLAWRCRGSLRKVGVLDYLFLAFLALVLASLAVGADAPAVAGRFTAYLGLMVVTPYLCGRLMAEQDVWRLARLLLLAALVVLPLCLLDYLFFTGRDGARWPFFGQEHGPLLVGALLATALLVAMADPFGFARRGSASTTRWLAGALPPALAFVLVWVAARGWLLAALVGMFAMVLACYRDRLLMRRYLAVAGLVLLVVVLALRWLPDSKGKFYAGLVVWPSSLSGLLDARTAAQSAGVRQVAGSGPVLGKESCAPLVEGSSSVAIRRMLYREAYWMFRMSPLVGVGVGRFGNHSCSGAGGYPHSPVLQAFAELGLLGGPLFVAMLLTGLATVVRRVRTVHPDQLPSVGLLLWGLLITCLFADQIYGNYLMSTGVYLLLGIAARIRADAHAAAS